MSFKLKFKLVNSKTKEIVDYMNCSIAIADGTVQSFNRKGELEGTAANVHLKPIQYANKDDINKKKYTKVSLLKERREYLAKKI